MSEAESNPIPTIENSNSSNQSFVEDPFENEQDQNIRPDDSNQEIKPQLEIKKAMTESVSSFNEEEIQENQNQESQNFENQDFENQNLENEENPDQENQNQENPDQENQIDENQNIINEESNENDACQAGVKKAIQEALKPIMKDEIEPVLITEINDFQVDSKSQQTTRRTSSVSEIQEGASYTDEEIELSIQYFKTKHVVPPETMKVEILNYLSERSQDAIDDEEYDKAADYENTRKELLNAFQTLHGQSDSNATIHQLQERLDQVLLQKQAIKDRYEETLNNHQENENRKLELLTRKHENEITAFEEQCQSKEFLQLFTKPSPQLIQLKNQQRSLALAHDFDGAKSFKEKVDQLQVDESLIAQKKVIDTIRQNYQILIEKQTNERNCLLLNSRRKEKTIQKNLRKEIEANILFEKQVRQKIEESSKKKINKCPLISAPGKPQIFRRIRRPGGEIKTEQAVLHVQLGNLQQILSATRYYKRK